MLISFSQIKRKYNMNITGIVHVGGHYGEEIEDYINEGIQNIIIFEPLLNNFKILQKKCEKLNADIVGHQIALGSEKKIVEMYVSSNDALSSSILKPKIHLTQYTDILFDEKETVEVNILDNYETDNCNFLNMDVQGYELEVLKGGIKTLENIDYVYCEVNRDEVYENNAYIEDIDKFLLDLNFERVVVEWTGGTWGDALYIKNKGE